MDGKRLYILAGFDDSTARTLGDLQDRILAAGFMGRQTMGIPMHATLGSFPSAPEEEARLCALLRELSARVAAFPVTFNHIGVFGGGEVLFAAPDADGGLLSLKERFGPALGWTPHATLLIDGRERILEALPVALEAFRSFQGRVAALHLYEFFPARHILSVPLAGTTGRDDCIFCRIARGETPCMKVYEDERAMAFMDAADDVDGHILVIPKEHAESILDCGEETAERVMRALRAVSRHLVADCGYDGVNLLNASGRAAGQSVGHLHFHIVPRRHGDGIDAWPAFPGAKEEKQAVWRRVKMG